MRFLLNEQIDGLFEWKVLFFNLLNAIMIGTVNKFYERLGRLFSPQRQLT